MDNEVGLGGFLDVGDVVAYDVELLYAHTRIGFELFYPARRAEHEVVQTDNLPNAQLLSLGGEELHHVET